ncbi:MAG: hypothetical protein BroJett029_26920 [Alphaproteobacteria bacterium]|nr:MAG: hypothetical protein BroJett029_26920 [Alphaproteobacteria bacterium]
MTVRQFPIRLGVEGDGEVKTKLQAVINAATGVEQKIGEIGRAARAGDISAYANSLDGLRTKYVPLAAAQDHYRQTLAELRTALANNIISTNEHAAALARAKDAFAAQVVGIRAAQGAVAGARPTYRNFGSIVQQAGFQVGDFAVQVASGQGAVRAFVQQGTQLISMFGPWGAIIGAAGAVVGALAIGLFDLGEATDQASSAQERHNELMERAQELTEGLAVANVNLADARRAEAHNRVVLMRQDLRELEKLEEDRRRKEQGQFGPIGDEIAGRQVPIVDHAARASNAEIERLRREIRDFEAELWGDQISRGTVPGMQRTIERIGAAASDSAERVHSFGEVLAGLDAKAAASAVQEYADAVELVERTVEQGLTDQQRYERQVAELDRALATAAAGGYRLSIEAQEALNRALREADPAFRAAQKAAEEANREQERLAEERARILARPFEHAAEGIQDKFTDVFEDIYSGGVDSFEDLASSAGAILRRLAAEISTLLLFRPVIAGVLGSVGLGSIAGGVGLMPTSGSSAGGGLPGGVGIGDLLGVGKEFLGSGSGIHQWLFGLPGVGGSHPIEATAGWLGSGGQFLGSSLLADAFLPIIGSALPGMLSGNFAQAGLGGVGALAGTAIAGPFGGLFGGMLGDVHGGTFEETHA